MKKTFAILLIPVLLGLFNAQVYADDLAANGRRILEKYQHAVVTVEIVLKVTYSAGGQTSPSMERKLDLTGTVIDPSGLSVLALSAVDPGELYQRMASSQSRTRVDTEVSDVKVLLSDGTELPAEIVLRDKDLDLAFIRPKSKPSSPMAAVDLKQSGSAQLLDQVITLNRLNKAASRAYAASVERVSAVIQKPRTFYIPDSTMTSTAMGSPAFLPDGKLLGVFVMRALNSGATSGSSLQQNLSSIILPASDILKASEQAPEAKGDSDGAAADAGSGSSSDDSQ